MEQISLQNIIFAFFLFSCTGWIMESMQESIVRKQFISKGFFKGPYIPCHGIGGLSVVAIGSHFKDHPIVMFFLGLVLCTIVEYITAIFLEKCFKVKCWDYTTYPHTKWLQFRGRICLTISLFFGFITLFLVYFYWDFAVKLVQFFGDYVWIVNLALSVIFLIDAFITCAKIIRDNKEGIVISGYAVFSVLRDSINTKIGRR
ncbi:MAG: hypothetical protein Ta2G_00130 [Termitinemataceae bacterium]|nr:MAG: hypothetical protein Ta2G_00130 [Termitinemataceae bacterium]